MSDSIRLSNDVLRRIDKICAENDPAKDPVVLSYMARVPKSEDRVFWLDYTRKELRAHLEVAFALRGLLEFAESRGEAHVLALDFIAEFKEVADRLSPVGPDSELPGSSADYNRRADIEKPFSRDPDLGDGLGNAVGNRLIRVVEEVFELQLA